MIKYQYAKDDKGKLIDINSLDRKEGENLKFFCVGCDNNLIPKLGQIKKHHFAHKKVVACSAQTYLHLLGKKLFFDNYTECLQTKKPFYIEIYQKRVCNHYEEQFQIICNLKRITTRINLIDYFDKITLETRESSFIPDVMLTSKNAKEKVFIEIAVTHFSSEHKLSSNYRIIEIKIKEEKDLEPIKNKFLSIKNSKIKFKNFKIKEVKGSLCKGHCEKTFNFFVLGTDSRGILYRRNLNQICQYLKKEQYRVVKYYITKDLDYYYPHIFKYFIAKSYIDKLEVKNCFICRYHTENNSWIHEDTSGTPIFCKFLKIKCNSNRAVNCEYFRAEKKYIAELFEYGQEVIKEAERNEPDIEYEFENENDQRYDH